MEKMYCFECDKDVMVEVRVEKTNHNIHGQNVVIDERVFTCPICETEYDFDDYDLDGKKGLSDKEVASYIMALDGITFKFDATYLGWDFVEGADIEEDDLKKGEFSEDNIDGKIDENIQKALDSMDNDELKEIAQNIYDENFYKEPWYKKIFG